MENPNQEAEAKQQSETTNHPPENHPPENHPVSARPKHE